MGVRQLTPNMRRITFTGESLNMLVPISAGNYIELHWVINSQPGSNTSPLLDTVKSLPMRPGRPSVWAACEFSTMRQLRAYFKQERKVAAEDIYISSYWKKGISEEKHNRVKRKDALMLRD